MAEEQFQLSRGTFADRLNEWQTVSVGDIRNYVISGDYEILYILGNGFDLMHGAHSSYNDFRDFLKENDAGFLESLEDAFAPGANIWADFESALAFFDMSFLDDDSMKGSLEIFNAYENESYTPIDLAANNAAWPFTDIVNRLPDKLRSWAETLSIKTDTRPLQDIVKNGKVLCFNYTEFAEELYGVSEENICYIHGCRKENMRANELVIGHMPEINNYDLDEDPEHVKDPLAYIARDHACSLIQDSDEKITKNCERNISVHKDFFNSLQNIETVIVIGHSLAKADWGYFNKIISTVHGRTKVKWYFGCYGLRDLKKLEKLLKTLNIRRSDIYVFRTDNISGAMGNNGVSQDLMKPAELSRDLTTLWQVETEGDYLKIFSLENAELVYDEILPVFIRDAFFISEEYLMVLLHGNDIRILLWKWENYQWSFACELESKEGQGMIELSLRAFLNGGVLTFVYYDRVCEYNLSKGELTYEENIKGARKQAYEGYDITDKILRSFNEYWKSERYAEALKYIRDGIDDALRGEKKKPKISDSYFLSRILTGIEEP